MNKEFSSYSFPSYPSGCTVEAAYLSNVEQVDNPDSF